MLVGREQLWLKTWPQNDAALSGPVELSSLPAGLLRLKPE
jgi:hypothetical protein